MIQPQQAAMAGEVRAMRMGFWGGDDADARHPPWHHHLHHHHRHSQPEDEDVEDEGFSQDDIMPPWRRSSSISSPLSHNKRSAAGSADDQDSGDDQPYDYAWPSVASSDKRRKSESHETDLDSRPSSSSGPPSSPSLPSRSRPLSSGTGSLFFKTKLCIKFSAGTCPYNSSCNFAHGMEELRKPPPGWEEIVAVQDAERGPRNSKETSSQYIVSSAGSGNMAESQRFRRTRRCKKYYSEEGCPYGDRCNFLHDDQARARESNAISLGPTTNPAGGGGNGGNSGERPSNWKTRMCNKWELTGHCPFGQKCNFAHGFTELQLYAGSHIESDTGSHSGSGTQTDAKSTWAPSKSLSEAASLYVSTVYSTDGHNVATVKHRSGFVPTVKVQKHVNTALPNWKGPADEVSTIYGDWIEEDE